MCTDIRNRLKGQVFTFTMASFSSDKSLASYTVANRNHIFIPILLA